MTVRLLTEAHHLEQVWRLRCAAWFDAGSGLDRHFPDGRWREPVDDCALQFGVVVEGRVVAAARLSIHESLADCPAAPLFRAAEADLAGRFGWFSRLVVHPEWQGQGLGRALDLARIEHARSAGLDAVCVHVRHAFRVDALQRLGFRTLAWDGRGAQPPLMCTTEVPMLWHCSFAP